MNSQQLYQQTKNKTRVVICGDTRKMSIAMVLHVLHYLNRHVDSVLESTSQISLVDDNDFVLIEADENAHELNANIALLSTQINDNKLTTIQFIDSITNGGILVYNEEDEVLKKLVEESSKPIQKYPYQTPKHTLENDVVFLNTNEGKLPLKITQNNLENLMGVKWVCQHMGIDEDDFYEAIGSFKIRKNM
jgi:UDP-N-acetylmuramate: L-alanyl-gamma-D-glutamyl-meso-diaminopimelate ligase